MSSKTKFTVSGKIGGRYVSVPGFDWREDARAYALLKGWSEVKVIRSIESV